MNSESFRLSLWKWNFVFGLLDDLESFVQGQERVVDGLIIFDLHLNADLERRFDAIELERNERLATKEIEMTEPLRSKPLGFCSCEPRRHRRR